MSIKQRRHVLKAIVPLFVLALSAGAMSACGDNNSDTASTEPTVEEAPTTTEATVEEAPTTTEATVEEAPTTTAVEEPAALTAETTGTYTSRELLTGEIKWEVEVTMEDGSVRYFPIDEETLELIWPEGTTTSVVRVVIEEIDGEQRITGLAE